MSTTSSVETFTFLVQRPGRMMQLAVVASIVLLAGVVLALRWGGVPGRGWLNLLVVVPGLVAFFAVIRGGRSRCEVSLGERELLLESLDNSPLLGRKRRASWRWRDVRATTWLNEHDGALRVDFAAAPRALVFTGSRARLEALAAAIGRHQSC